jgi:16S rRNA processing protein RimM
LEIFFEITGMENKEFVCVGTFGQPQGLKGEIKINIFTSSFESFKMLKNFYINDKKTILIFDTFRKVGKKIICSVEGCIDRDAALLFKGNHIFALRKDFPKTKDNEYYIVDLIDSRVLDMQNNNLGIVEDIKNFGAGDLLEINSPKKKNFYIPMNNENLVSVDAKNKIVILNPINGLLD